MIEIKNYPQATLKRTPAAAPAKSRGGANLPACASRVWGLKILLTISAIYRIIASI